MKDVPTMWKLLKGIGLRRIIVQIDFAAAAAITAVIMYVICDNNMNEAAIRTALPIIMAASGALIAVALAGLAIIVAMADAEFVKILRKEKVFDNLLMFFWIPAFAAAICMASGFFAIILELVSADSLVLAVALTISIGAFSYSMFSLVLALGTAVKFGHYRAEFIIRGVIGKSEESEEKS